MSREDPSAAVPMSGAHPMRQPYRSRRLSSAGQILGVGLLCFSLWLLIDARQLYNSALAAPLGARRSAAVAVLRPIARASEWLGLDRLENGANRILGHNASTPGGLSIPAASTTKNKSVTKAALGGPAALSLRDLGPRHLNVPIATTTTPMIGATNSIVIAQPSATNPLRVLVVGDSLGEDLEDGLEDVVGSNPAVALIDAAQADTGLADPAYYSWPDNLQVDLARYHPQIVAVMIGGNDWQPFLGTPSRVATPGTAYWRVAYGARVSQFVSEATSQGIFVVWVGLPIMGPQSPFPPDMAPDLNSVFEQQIDANQNAMFVSSWPLFTNSAGQYAMYLPTAGGDIVDMRDPDGVHLAIPAGSDRLANAVIVEMQNRLHINF